MPYRMEDHDRYEFCPHCLSRSCRGCDKGNPLLPLSEPAEAEKKKPKPLRVTDWKPPERKKAG